MSTALAQYVLLATWALLLTALAAAAYKREIRRAARVESELGALISQVPEAGRQ
jgi:hypothetical protein